MTAVKSASRFKKKIAQIGICLFTESNIEERRK